MLIKFQPETLYLVQQIKDQLKFNWEQLYYVNNNIVQFQQDSASLGLLSWRIENNVFFHISKIELFPIYQGKGLGKLFIEELEQLALLLNCKYVDLWCEENVIKFYQKQQYKHTQIEDFVNNVKIFKMIKRLKT